MQIPSRGTRTVGTSKAVAAPSRSLVVGWVAAAVLTLLLVTLLVRVTQLQLSPGTLLSEQMSPRVTSLRDMALRGEIKDRTGRVVAVTKFGFRVAIDPTILDRDMLDANVLKLAGAMGVEPETVGVRLYEVLAANDEVVALNPLALPEPSGLRALLVSLSSSHSEVTGGEAGFGPADLDDQSSDAQPRKPVRFLVLGGVLNDEQVVKVRALKMAGVTLDQRALREYPSGTILATIVGLVGAEPAWGVGAERRLNDELEGTDGSISYTRDRSGRPLWMERGQVQPSQSGDDIDLSIDMELQRIVYEELMRGVEDADAAGGRCIVLDPLTGEVLAMVDIARDVPGLTPFPWADNPKSTPEDKAKGAQHDAWRATFARDEAARLSTLGLDGPRSSGHPRYLTLADDPNRRANPAMARNRCIEDVYEPGSTFKAFVWSVVTETGVMNPADVVDTENGKWNMPIGRHIEDVHAARTMTWDEVLVNSSNIGMIKGALKLSRPQLRDVCLRFGFGKKTGIELPGEASGIVTTLKTWSAFTQSSVAHGYEIAVTPIQMARAFCAFSRPGELAGTLPQVHLRAVVPQGGSHASPKDFQRGVIYRVLPSDVAVLTRDVMARVAEAAESKMKDTPVGGWRYSMFGKSGTAEIPLTRPPAGKMKPRGIAYFDGQYNSSFIAAGPTEQPRLVVLVVIDDPGPKAIASRKHYGSWVAAPVVRRVIERSLTYLGTSPTPHMDPSEVRPHVGLRERGAVETPEVPTAAQQARRSTTTSPRRAMAPGR